MSIVRFLDYLPDHLGKSVILDVNPKFFNYFKKLYNLRPEVEKNYAKNVYSEILNLEKTDSMIKSLELEYYDLFESLFSKYLSEKKILSEELLTRLISAAALIGNKDYFDRFVSMIRRPSQKIDFENATNSAARGGHLDMFNHIQHLVYDNPSKSFYLPRHKDYYQSAFLSAVGGGQLEMFNRIRNSMIRDHFYFNDEVALNEAVKTGQFEMFEYLKDLILKSNGKIDYFELLKTAAKEGQLEMFKLINDYLIQNELISKKDYFYFLEDALYAEQKEIIKYLINILYGGEDIIDYDYNETVGSLFLDGKIGTVNLLLDSLKQNGIDIDSILQSALIVTALNNHRNEAKTVLDFMKREGIIPNYKNAIDKIQSTGIGHDGIKLLKELIKDQNDPRGARI